MMQGRDDAQPAAGEGARAPSVWVYAALTAVVWVLLGWGGYAVFSRERAAAVVAGTRTLQAVAELKASQLTTWRRERMDDASVSAAGAIRRRVVEWMGDPSDDALRLEIVDSLESIRRHYRYQNLVLTDRDGAVRISLDAQLAEEDCLHTADMARQAVEAGAAVFGEVFTCRVCDRLHLDVASPVLDDGGGAVAVLILRSDPEDALFPMLGEWPSPGLRAESLLVRKEGSAARVLNRTRAPQDAGGAWRIGIEDGRGPLGEAVRGRTGTLEGVDDRGVPVLSYLQPVPDSPWYLVTTVERGDLLAGVRRAGRRLLLLTAALALLAAVGVGAHYKHVGKRAYARLYAAERMRREILEEFRDTLYGIGDGVISVDAQGRVRRMNAVAERLTGWTEREAAGRPAKEVFRIINEDTRAEVESPLARVLREGGIVGLANHTLLIARGGEERPIADSGSAIVDDEGLVVGAVLVFRDQTREMEARRMIRREQANLQSILSAAPVAMLVFDGGEQVIHANRAAERMFGQTLDALRHRRCGDFLGCENRTAAPEGCGRGPACPECLIFEALRAVLQGADGVFDRETRVRILSGEAVREAVLRFSAAAVDLDGQRQVVMALHDVTEQRQVEDQLRQAQKMEAVGRLAGGVAHDFNNMLEIIMGHAELAHDQAEPSAPVRQDLQEIIKAAQRSADLTRQLLAFARKQTVSPQPLDLNATVKRMLSMLRRLIGEHLELTWRPSPDLGTVEMDPAQVDQVLANLMVNARDAIDGTGEIVIETRNATVDDLDPESGSLARPGDYVVLSVRDNGRGIAPEVLEHIFEPFFTTKGVGQGTGLGLATVYGIVRQNSGLIRVRSEPGKGTEFTILLPRRERPLPASAPAEKERRLHGGETVLIVEDEPAILTFGRRALERHGYVVLTAQNPGEALDRVREHSGRIDLLLTDLIMPGMNGRELSEAVALQVPGIRILFMSGYTSNVIVHHGILETGLSFLQKPFSARGLAEKVREVLDNPAAEG